MEIERFKNQDVGRPVMSSWPRLGDFWSFLPSKLPRELSLDAETQLLLSEADAALGWLAGAGRLLPEPSLLIQPYMFSEAVASSRIEGTQASLQEMLQAAAATEPTGRTADRDVTNYIAAMELGLQMLGDGRQVDLDLIKAVHARLMLGVEGHGEPGEFRKVPNWVASPTGRPQSARFVPPMPEELEELLADWIHLLQSSAPMPPLIKCALLHAAFLTLHPFVDGNGRVGRLLIVLYLMSIGRLPQPLLYISPYFERRRNEYYDHLQATRETGDLSSWFKFFLTGVRIQGKDALHRTERLWELREKYRGTLAGRTRSRAPEVVDLIMANPFLTVPFVQHQLKTSTQGAVNLVKQIESFGWVRKIEIRGPRGRYFWVADEVLDIVEDIDLSYPASAGELVEATGSSVEELPFV